MEFPIQINRRMMEIPIIYLNGPQVEILRTIIYIVLQFLKVVFILANSEDPNEMLHHA